MYDIERREEILKLLRQKKSCSVSELAQILHYSEATIRRDLNLLDKEMRIRKTFGGAVFPEAYGKEVPISVRQNENMEVKKQLCHAVEPLIRDNMTVFLSASTTLQHVIPFLDSRFNMTVVTNSPDYPRLFTNPNIVVLCTGGRLLHHSNAYVGKFARNMIQQVNADLMLFSVTGISDDGRCTVSSTGDDIFEAMIGNAAKTCLLADHSKFGKCCSYTVCNLKNVDVLITDLDTPLASLPGRTIIV